MEKVKNIMTQKIVVNLVYALVTVIYFICFSTQCTGIGTIQLNKYINFSSLFFLIISIIMMEYAFKKEETLTFINGIEFLIIAIFILLTQHMTRILDYSVQVYTLSGANLLAIYYILKSAILYTKEQQDKLNSLSDIKDIVKEEPIKKISKRKNKKEEGK